MCIIICAVFAIIFFTLCKVKKIKKLSAKNEFTIALIFSSASLMWCVDGFFALKEGKPFFNISKSDFILALIVCALTLFLYVIFKFYSRKNNKSV